MSIESSTETIKGRVGEDCGLGATLKFDFGDGGVIHIDATQVPNVVTNDNADAQCTVQIALEDFESMMSGDLAPTTAFMSGKLKVDGDMGIAMKLQTVL
jgi:putative sterol carrier protein